MLWLRWNTLAGSYSRPVPVAGRVVDHALHVGVRHLRHDLHPRFAEAQDRGGEVAQPRPPAGVRDQRQQHQLTDEVLGHEVLRRSGDVDRSAAEPRRAPLSIAVPERAQHRLPSSARHSSNATLNFGQLVHPERERGGHPEVASSTVQRPEQLRVLVLAGRDPAPVGGDQVDREQVVAGQAERAVQPAGAAAEREAANARRRDPASRGGQAVAAPASTEPAAAVIPSD